jgi:hypothetical protein
MAVQEASSKQVLGCSANWLAKQSGIAVSVINLEAQTPPRSIFEWVVVGLYQLLITNIYSLSAFVNFRGAIYSRIVSDSLFVWLVADCWCWFVLREKYWLLVADLFWEKSTVGWWLISQTNRVRPEEHGLVGLWPRSEWRRWAELRDCCYVSIIGIMARLISICLSSDPEYNSR